VQHPEEQTNHRVTELASILGLHLDVQFALCWPGSLLSRSLLLGLLFKRFPHINGHTIVEDRRREGARTQRIIARETIPIKYLELKLGKVMIKMQNSAKVPDGVKILLNDGSLCSRNKTRSLFNHNVGITESIAITSKEIASFHDLNFNNHICSHS